MTEDLDFSRLSPAEQAVWRAKKVQEEEEQYQARLQRRSELHLQRTESFNEAKEQRQLVAKTLLGHSRVLVVVQGKAREAKIQAGLVQEPGVLKGHFWGLELPNCRFPIIPEGLGRLREIFEVVQHPKDLPLIREKGVLNCGRHYSNHEFVFSFRGLKLANLGLEECTCVEGLHEFKNISTSFLSLSPWSIEPGQEFDVPEGGQEIVEKYLAAGFVENLRSPRKTKVQEEEAKPTPEEILEKAVADWEKDDD